MSSDTANPTPRTSGRQEEEHEAQPVVFCLIAVVVGIVTGLGAIAFHYLIGFFHNVFSTDAWPWVSGSESLLEPSIWGPSWCWCRSSAASAS